jgi:FMNH2-dependent dimethyl sulfone monooxygenase
VVLKLWTVEEEFDHVGKFFKIEKGFSQAEAAATAAPADHERRQLRHRRALCGKAADMAFIGFYEDSLDTGKAALAELRRIGREDYSREFKVWTSCRVVCREQGRRDPTCRRNCTSA